MSSFSANAKRRKLQFPRYSSTAKEQLEQALVTSVDACLKELRKIIRKLSTTFEAHAVEVAIIQRIVYKSRNQHKNSLFWRNLTETRRMAARVEEVAIGSLIDSFRSTFYSEATGKSTWKNAPWTQIPDKGMLQYVLNRVEALSSLYVKAIEAYQRAYRAYERFANTTSFLPLTLSLLGICARLSLLTTDLQHASVHIWENIHQLLTTFQPPHSICRCKRPVLHSSVDLGQLPEATTASSQPPFAPELGEAISREIFDFQQPSIIQKEKMDIDELPVDEEETITFEVEVPIIQTIPATEVQSTQSEAVTTQIVKQSKKPKKRVVRDEIDDIFG